MSALRQRLSRIALRARGIRVRLALSYTLILTLVAVGAGVLFRGVQESNVRDEARVLLFERWNAARGFVKIHDGRVDWEFNTTDQQSSLAVERLRRRTIIADATGRILHIAPTHPAPELETTEQLHLAARFEGPEEEEAVSRAGEHYMVRRGPFQHDGQLYVMSMALPLSIFHQEARRLVAIYLWSTPLLIILAGVMGWYLAGRALRPLRRLSSAVDSVSGEMLSVRLAPRGTGDEVDVLTTQFNQMLDRLERSFERVKRFTVDASHELRTPITGIRGQLEVALMTAQTPEEYARAIQVAMEDVERLSTVVRSLLLLSQSESGQVALKRSDVDLSALIREVTAQFEIPARASGVKLQTVVPEICIGSVDPAQFLRLLRNLLSNAVKYTRSGDVITVALTSSDHSITLTVADTGPGIAAEHLPFIFERFYRVPQDGDEPEKGVGLGLSFVEWIAQAHGGKVEVRSEVGQGTTFVTTIPVGESSTVLRVFPID